MGLGGAEDKFKGKGEREEAVAELNWRKERGAFYA